MTETQIDASHAHYLEARRQTQLLRTIRTLLIVWTVVGAIGAITGLVVWVNSVAPY